MLKTHLYRHLAFSRFVEVYRFALTEEEQSSYMVWQKKILMGKFLMEGDRPLTKIVSNACGKVLEHYDGKNHRKKKKNIKIWSQSQNMKPKSKYEAKIKIWSQNMKPKENSKTKEAVWDDLRTAMKPEKKLWTAEIEIYRLVTSNGVFGDGNVVNENLGFRFLDPNFGLGI